MMITIIQSYFGCFLKLNRMMSLSATVAVMAMNGTERQGSIIAGMILLGGMGLMTIMAGCVSVTNGQESR